MCVGCWDSEKKAQAIQKGRACSQIELWKMSIEELKYKLSIENLRTGKDSFNVFKAAITDELSAQNISWIITKENVPTRIVVNFI